MPMTSFVALLRGINVGGRNCLPMQTLREQMSELGCENIQTYIQSGNVVFSFVGAAKKLEVQIADTINASHGFRPQVMILAASKFKKMAATNPHRTEGVEPKFLHVGFLATKAKSPNMERMHRLAANGEEYRLVNNTFYLYAPNGIGRSKLASEVEKCLGVAVTSRNWRTVLKIVELVDKLP
jgi:uncharacterized protein (DUF1697 family)